MQTFSTEHFEIRIESGLLEMRTERAGLLGTGAGAERALSSMLRVAAVRAICVDIRASKNQLSGDELGGRIRQLGRLCRGMPIAFIGRKDQSAEIDAAMRTLREMGELGRAFRERCQARAWLNSAATPR